MLNDLKSDHFATESHYAQYTVAAKYNEIKWSLYDIFSCSLWISALHELSMCFKPDKTIHL